MQHKYLVGTTLDFIPSRQGWGAASSRCKIVRLLSTDGDDPQYRVKCPVEGFERVVRESQLTDGTEVLASEI